MREVQRLDTVVLAAGSNQRLKMHVPAGMKPLLLINGRPLIVSAVAVALQHSERVVVVASPGNVQPICELLETNNLLNGNTFVIVQPKPGGPGAAVLYGTEVCTAPDVMILCADNILHERDVTKVVHAARQSPLVIGGRKVLNENEAKRFTTVGPDCTVREGTDLREARWEDGAWRVWLGPLVVPRQPMRDVLRRHLSQPGELKIGPHLNECAEGVDWVEVDSYDVGTVDSLNGYMNGGGDAVYSS